MLNLFYQNKSLNDTLIINMSSSNATEIQTNGDVTIGKAGNIMVFANVANASKKIDNALLKDGLLFPHKEIVTYLSTILNQDISVNFDNGFKVGKVISCQDIKGTHLHKCVVDIGTKKLDIVCGAPNAKEGLKVVVATDGTMLPNGKSIVAGQLLGNKSEGMLCSYRELEIQKESKGIIELDDEYNVGDYFMEVYANAKK